MLALWSVLEWLVVLKPLSAKDIVEGIVLTVGGFLGLFLICAMPISGLLWFLMIGKSFKLMFAQRKRTAGCLLLLLALAIPVGIILAIGMH